MKKEKKSDIVKIAGKEFNKEAFMLEDNHPAIGRMLIVDGVKFKIMDAEMVGPHSSGTFIKRMTSEDEQKIIEYEEILEELSEKLADKVDVKRMISENIRDKSIGELKTGIYILEQSDNGAKTEENHKKGCYEYVLHLNNQTFSFATGSDCQEMYNRFRDL